MSDLSTRADKQAKTAGHRVVSPVDPAGARAWNVLADTCSQASPFAHLAFAEAVREHLGIGYRLIAVPDADNNIRAGVMAFERQVLMQRRAVTPPFTPFTSVLFAAGPSEHEITSGISAYEPLLDALEERYGYADLRLHPSLTDVRAISWRGWNVQPFYTYCLNLGDESEVLERWSAGARRTFLRDRPLYEVVEHPNGIEEIVELCLGSYRRHGRDLPLEPERLAGLAAHLQTRGRARAFTAYPVAGGEAEAGVVILHDRTTAYYWIAGSRPGSAMTVLLGNVLPRLHRLGLRRFDFMGANTPGIAEFKRRFGPSLVSYYRIQFGRPRGAGLRTFLSV